MKAKDTIMSAEQIDDLEEQVEDAVFSGKETPSKTYLIANKQAEISFRAGKKEVVDWVESNIDRPSLVIPIELWDTKLKEWGIEDA